MLVLKLELWPAGNRMKAKELGVVRIERADVQDRGSQDQDVGDYVVIGDLKDETGLGWVTVEVKEFRRRLGAWELARRALDAVSRRLTRAPH